jgi:hypothetical protein
VAAVLTNVSGVIRNVVMVKMRDGYDETWLEDLHRRFQGLNCPGTVAYTIGLDLGLRGGGWTFAIVADFVDEDAYRGYDADRAHNALRAELAPHAEQLARVQFAP